MMLAKKWVQYIQEEYGTLEDCEDEAMVENVKNECVRWFGFYNKVLKDLDPNKDIEYINAWDNLVRKDKEFITGLYMDIRHWEKNHGKYEHVN